MRRKKMIDSELVGTIIENVEAADNEALVGSTSLAILQSIYFWNREYSGAFVGATLEMKHLDDMDAVLMAGTAVGELSDVMHEYNRGLQRNPKYAIDSEEKLQHEKIESGIADLVIAAIRMAQKNEIDLGRAISERIAFHTGVNMGEAIKQIITKLMQEARDQREDWDKENETDVERI
jgi:NTP pyrophosphatase (non-canonical NTP hydrolase)